MMINIVNIFKAIIHILCCAHLIMILYISLYPDQPSIKSYKRDIGDIKFPLTIKVCLNDPNFFSTWTRPLGYNHIRQYFKGNSFYSKERERFKGWAGHDESNSTLGSVKGFDFFIKLRMKDKS